MRFFCIGLIFISMLLSCRKEKASWNSAWSVPLVSDTLDLDNLVADSILSVDPSHYYQLEINRNILDLSLADYVEIPDTLVVQKYAISASLTIGAGTSFVNNVQDHHFDLQTAQLKKAHISSGKIRIEVKNPLETGTIFTVELPGVTDNGQTILKTFQAPAGTNQSPGTVSDEIDLSGYFIDLRGSGGGGYNLLQSRMTVQTDPNGGSTYINNQDSMKFIVHLEGLKLDYARGYFGNLVVSDTAELDVDFLQKVTDGNLDLPFTNIEFSIRNGIKVGARATLTTLTNTNQNTNQSVDMNNAQIGVPFYIEPASGSWNSLIETIRTILFTSANSNIEGFVENLGGHQQLGYKIEINPWGNVSGGWDEFFANSRLQVRMKAHMPLSAALNNLTIQDTFALDLKQDQNKSHLLSGELKLRVSNAFPLQGNVQLFLLDAQGQVIQTISSPNEITSSLYGTNDYNNNNLQVAKSALSFALSESTLSQINAVEQVVVRVVLNTPDPATGSNQQVLIPEGAFMGIQLGSSFQLENRF
jgi:hypothetical protein